MAGHHDHLELGKLDDLPAELANHMNVGCPRGEVGPVVDGIRLQGVVVARQDDYWLTEPIELPPHKGDHVVGHAIVVEKVTRDQEQIDLVRLGSVDDALEETPALLLVRGLLVGIAVTIAAQMHVGCVKNSQGSVAAHPCSMPH